MSPFISRAARALGSFAVIAALSGAAAQAGQPAFHENLPVTPGPFPTCASLCAVIKSDGSIARAHALTTSVHLATGQYQVEFFKPTGIQVISKCAWLVTPGLDTFFGTTPAEIGNIVGRAGTKNGLFVEIFDKNGNSLDAGFHVLVSC
jgi:hypothetical protein